MPTQSTTPRAEPRPRDIAIVGLACVMPGSPDVEAFWANVVDGVDCVAEVGRSRWLPEVFFDSSYDGSRRGSGGLPMSVSKWGGFVPDVGFDALAWGIPPASLASIDPAQLLMLKVAAGSLEDAGYGSGDGDGLRPFDRDRTSLVVATGSGGAVEVQAGAMLRLLLRCHGVTGPLPDDLDAYLPQLTEDGLPGALTSLISGRVANRLDLGGKNLTVDSACASVLVALEIACDDLAAGSSDVVLVGGVDLHNGAGDYVSFTAARALSRRGRCFAFDAGADGMTLAEGAGCVVLKRLGDAERDGDRVYAVVKGVAGSSDGRHLGLTAPRQEGQEKAVRRAYQRCGLSPADVGLVEAHGTGTPVGDRVELATTTSAFTEAGVAAGSVVLGSVKSNIGHIKCAAGMAALIKAAKAAFHGVLPPTLHITRPLPEWDRESSPFVFLDRARPWLDERRVVAVSSFGFGGTNFHAIVENHPPSSTPVVAGRPQWPAELVGFRGSDSVIDAALDQLAARLAGELVEPRQADRWRLRDIAAAVTGSGGGPVRLAIVATGLDDLAAKVTAARGRSPGEGVYWAGRFEAGGVAFLVPGPGAARTGMAADILTAFPPLRATANAARASVAAMLPPQAFDPDDHHRHDAALAEVAGPAAAIASETLARALAAHGVIPARVAGWNPLALQALAAAPLAQPAPTVAPPTHTDGGGPGADTDGEPGPTVAPPTEVDGGGAVAEVDGGGAVAEGLILDEIRGLNAAGIDVFVDVGPGDTLTGLVGRALPDTPHLAVAADRPGHHGLTALLHTLAQLAVTGVPVDLAALHTGRGTNPHHWDQPAPKPGWIVNGHCARTATGEPLPKGLRPADEAPRIRLADREPVPAGAPATSPLSEAEVAVVTEYMRVVEAMVEAGDAIVRGHAAATNGNGNGHGGGNGGNGHHGGEGH